MSGMKHTIEVIEEKIEKGLEAVHLKKRKAGNAGEQEHTENTVSVDSENLAMPEIHLKKKEEAKEGAGEYSVETDSLAVPEVHTGKVDLEPEKKDHKVSGISYDNLAMPEVHFKKK
jgi:hypothetical protein